MSKHLKPLHLTVSRKGTLLKFVISSIVKDGLVVTNISCAAIIRFHKLLYEKSEHVVMKLLSFERVADLTV